MNKSLQSAVFWTQLEELRVKLYSELIPLGVHLQIATQDQGLTEKMDELASAIDRYFASHKLETVLLKQPNSKRR